ncbi:MAG: methyltransferase [Pseudomonadota bacterium]
MEYSRDDFMNIAKGFQKTRIFLTSLELDVFFVLGEEQRTSKEIAKEIAVDHRALDRLMNALVSFEILKKEDGFFSNTESGKKFLLKTSPEFISFGKHVINMWDSWTTLTGAIKAGGTIYNREKFERSKEWFESFIEAMHDRASLQAPHVADCLDLSNVNKILDVGGGSGAYSFEFINRIENNEAKAFIFDLPDVTCLTKGYAEKAGLEKKILTLDGNYNEDDFGLDYDLIFMSAIIHINSEKQNEILVKKAYEALNENGQLVIQDFFISDDRTQPTKASVFALNMIVATEEGDCYTEKEIASWMGKAGLKNIHRKDTKAGGNLLIGRKVAKEI